MRWRKIAKRVNMIIKPSISGFLARSSIRAFRQGPWHCAYDLEGEVSPSFFKVWHRVRHELITHLTLGISPEIYGQSDQIIQRWICGLIHQGARQAAKRQPQHPRFYTLVYCPARDIPYRPFVSECEDGYQEIDHLQDRDGFNGDVKVLGQPVPEKLRPEKAF